MAALPGINFVGHLRSEKGVAEAARNLIRACQAAEVPVTANDFPDTGSTNAVAPLGLPTGFPYPITVFAVNPDTHAALGRFVDLARLRQNRYTVGSWYWELPNLPAAWQSHFALVNEVWVGSAFTQAAVSRVSPVPVVCIPPALEAEPHIGTLSRAQLGLPADAFVVLFVFDAMSTLARKNPYALIRAFRAAFPGEADVRLVLKASRLAASPERAQLCEAIGSDARVVLLDGVLPRENVQALLNLADCYASLHRCEGFGLTLAESMRLGKPVVATAYSGNLDFMTPRNSLGVGYSLVPLAQNYGPYEAGQLWAEPDEADAAEKLRWVYRNRSAAATMAARGRADILAAYTHKKIGARVVERLHAITRWHGRAV